MKQTMISYVKNKKYDHLCTPAYAVYPLLEYIKPEWVIWEPTDTNGNSEIARVLRDHDNKVISTKLETLNFLTDKPDFEFNCIITNPPYTLKNEFIKKCFQYGYSKHWAMLMPLTALEGIERGRLWKEHDIELLVLDRRVEFTKGACWFNTSWFCSGILPQNIMFATLKKELRPLVGDKEFNFGMPEKVVVA